MFSVFKRAIWMLPTKIDIPTTPAINAPDISSLYEIQESDLKGTGAFSRVVLGRHLITNARRAIKIIETSTLVGKKAEMVAHEREILRRTRHRSIVTLYETIQTPERVYMAMELMNDDLFNYIMRVRRVTEDDTRLVMQQLLSAVKYLHEQSIVHRDIKPENILINRPDDIRLADFGLAKVVEEWLIRSTPCGTSFYIAPEVIRGIESQGAKPLCTTRDAVKCVDLWSSGVVMFILLSGRPPFSGQVKTSAERKSLLTKIDRGVLFPEAQWENISEEAKDLVMKLLTRDADKRITAAQALLHPFFRTEHRDRKGSPDLVAHELSPGAAVEEETDRDKLKEEMEAIQEDIVETGDTEGDNTSYKGPEVISAPPTQPGAGARMSQNAVIGPAALKRSK
jgi:serine/threonine protein kinase